MILQLPQLRAVNIVLLELNYKVLHRFVLFRVIQQQSVH